jgi:membrane protein
LIDHLGGDAVAAPADRILAWAARRSQRVFGYNPWQLGAHVLHTALRHRVTGPAAEMSFFAMLTLVPLTVAVGAALGQIQRFVGPEKIARGQDAAISLVRVVISPRLTDGVVDPFVRAQLSQPQRGSAAIGGLLLTWWLAGRLFAATSRALDTAYHDRHQRLSAAQRLIALGFAFGSVVVVVLTLGIMVDAPFMDENQAVEVGVSRALVTAWYVARWPVVLAVLVVFLLCLYRFAPSVRHAWRATWSPAPSSAWRCGSWPPSPSGSTWPSAAAPPPEWWSATPRWSSSAGPSGRWSRPSCGPTSPAWPSWSATS